MMSPEKAARVKHLRVSVSVRSCLRWTARIVLAFGVLCNTRATAQAIDKAVMNSTVLITYKVDPTAGKDNPRSLDPSFARGTGFLLFSNLGFTKGSVYLVTNKHNLPPEGKQNDIQIRVVVRDDDGSSRVAEVTVPVVGPDGKYYPSVQVHPDPDTDVAAINIAWAAFSSKFQVLIDAITTGKRLEPSMLLSVDQVRASSIGVGSQVYVLGFPAALYDPRNVSPVLRVGVISTDPVEGFSFNDELRQTIGLPKHINGFLIDSNVYPGSSGSLVIAGPDTAAGRPEKGQPETSAWRPRILGIVAGSIPIFDAPLRSFERIGLGIVYSADAIRDVIDLFEKPHISTVQPPTRPDRR